jgi:hypothetical protein
MMYAVNTILSIEGSIRDFSRKRKFRFAYGFLSAGISFVFGLSIYLLWREPSNLVYQAFSVAGASPLIDGVRGYAIILPGWFIRSLPDGLWMLSFSLTILTIWKFVRSRKAMLWYITAVLAGVLWEGVQAFSILPGQYDHMDLAFISLAAVVPLCFTRKSDSK